MSNARARRPLFSGDLFERMIALLIALITVIAGLIGYLITDADAQSGNASRLAQQYVMQALGLRARGEIAGGYAISDAYRMWLEMDTLARAAEERGQPADVERYAAARDELAELSPLLQAPYFDAGSGEWPDVSAYEADTYLIEVTALGERFSQAFTVSDAWGAKSGDYTLQLTLLTISLFLYGLCTTIDNRARWLFVALGTTMTMVTLVWVIVVVLRPVPAVADGAIVAYARGVGAAYQDDDAAAVAAFDEALVLAPDYANAYYQRANALFRLGRHEEAVAAYSFARAAGRDDSHVAWNLGWANYMLGRFADAEQATGEALGHEPGQVALHFNLGLARLAAGDLSAARAAYDTGFALSVEQVAEARAAGEQPPASLWWYLSTAATDLNHLLDCVSPAASCDDAPPRTALAIAPELSEAAGALTRELKSLAVSLEYGGEPPADQPAPDVGQLQFARGVIDPAGKLIGYAPLVAQASNMRFGTVQEAESEFATAQLIQATPRKSGPLYTMFEFAGMHDGAFLVLKVYHDDREIPGLRLTQVWSLGPQGNAALPITPQGSYSLAPGDYQVELYADGQLVQQGTVTIPSADATTPPTQP